MLWDKRSDENNNAVDDIMEMGRYTIVTTRRTDSSVIQRLISALDGLNNIQYEHNSFTAILLPKVLKKVATYKFKILSLYGANYSSNNRFY